MLKYLKYITYLIKKTKKNKKLKMPKKEKESLSERTAKNSIFNFVGNLVSKFGGLVFTIILARLLLPEAFGIYNLVLSIVMVFLTFTNLGVGGTIVRYMSESIGNNNRKKARSYFRYLIKFRAMLLALVALAIALSSKLMATHIFQKPQMVLPLVFSSIYILSRPLFGTSKSLFQSLNNFRNVAYMQIIFYTSRILIVLGAIYLVTSSFLVSAVFLAMALTSIICGVFGYFFLKGNRDLIFGEVEKIDTKRILSYLGYVSLIAVSLKFFGNIDTLMLGRFVDPQFIGYYNAALNLVAGAAGLFGFGAVLLPAFTRINKERFKRGFQKTLRYVLMLSIPSLVGAVIIGRYFIFAIYGSSYLPATTPFYCLAALILISPLISFYTSLLKSKERPKAVFKAVLFSLILNVFLNYFLIRYFLSFSQELAILGAALATVISRGIYLLVMTKKTNNLLNLKANKGPFLRATLASLVMAIFLILFTSLLDMNLFLGILEIVFGAGIYFSFLWLIGGLKKEDWDLFSKIFIKKIKSFKK